MLSDPWKISPPGITMPEKSRKKYIGLPPLSLYIPCCYVGTLHATSLSITPAS
ncbi:MAG: hypothetical protein MGF17_05665 [Trichodesmium sp. MAG_R04]|nr:hypothetical protein [Trichodesmium sp. MAG_R04]